LRGFESSGLTVATVDLMIPAHAREDSLTLVTNDSALLQLRRWIDVVSWTTA